MNNGLQLSGTGQVNLGSGNLIVNDLVSGMSGGAPAQWVGPSLAAGSIVVGVTGAAAFTQSSGTNFGGTVILGENIGSAGTYNLNGGLLNLVGLYQESGSAAFNFTSGTLQSGGDLYVSAPILLTTAGSRAVFDNGGTALTLAGTVWGPGALEATGTGTLYLYGANSYSGGTYLDEGTLIAESPDALLDGSNLVIGDGSLFGAIEPASAAGPAIAAASGGASAVPEPNTFLLLIAALGSATAYLSRSRLQRHFSHDLLLADYRLR